MRITRTRGRIECVGTHHLGLAAVPQRQVSEEAGEVVPRSAERQVLDLHDVARQRGVFDPEDGLLLRIDRVRASAFERDRCCCLGSFVLHTTTNILAGSCRNTSTQAREQTIY